MAGGARRLADPPRVLDRDRGVGGELGEQPLVGPIERPAGDERRHAPDEPPAGAHRRLDRQGVRRLDEADDGGRAQPLAVGQLDARLLGAEQLARVVRDERDDALRVERLVELPDDVGDRAVLHRRGDGVAGAGRGGRWRGDGQRDGDGGTGAGGERAAGTRAAVRPRGAARGDERPPAPVTPLLGAPAARPPPGARRRRAYWARRRASVSAMLMS